jgi:hypothetical protein
VEADVHYSAIKALRLSKAASLPRGSGYVAVILIPETTLQVMQVLEECFYCTKLDDNKFSVMVSDNFGNPIVFDSEASAISACLQLGSTLEKKYIFFCYRSYGLKIDIPQEVTISFVKRGSV